MDLVDFITDHQDPNILANFKRAPEPPPPNGYCLHCDEEIESGAPNQRFCDAECRDQYDKRLAADRKNHGKH